MLDRSVAIQLLPELGDWGAAFSELPSLLDAFIAADFDAPRCRDAVAARIEASESLAAFLEPDAALRGECLATDALLYLDEDVASVPWQLRLERTSGMSLDAALDPGEVATAAGRIRRATRASTRGELEEALDFLGDHLDHFVSEAHGSASPEMWPAMQAAGIYRREHASIAFRSGSTSLLVDPIAWMAAPHIPEAPTASADGGAFDAILITHTHNDHWHLPSTQHFSQRDTRVVVPRVARRNLLAYEDPLAAMELSGHRAEAPDWGSVLTIGDFEVEVLPFYGEQPTRDAPGAPDAVRNWGNAYSIRCDDYSALVLADTGCDPAGDTAAVIDGLHARVGPTDFVLACTREFPCPFFGGLSHYWAALPFDRLRELFAQWRAGALPFATAGASGIAAACRAASARAFLPYANGFEGVGRAISDTGWGGGEPAEAATLERVSRALGDAGSVCETLAWNPGDAILCTGGKFCLEPMVDPLGNQR